ncbi:hypothetical protein BH09BAC4_BH09BAC4_06660 [soil metagenome]
MEASDISILNAGPILSELRTTLQTLDVSTSVYLQQTRNHTPHDSPILSPVRNLLGINQYVLPQLLQRLGIRSLTVSTQYELSQLTNFSVDMPEGHDERNLWHYLKTGPLLAELTSLFAHCQTIAFDDWSNLAAASDVWSGLLSHVIKPIGRKDLEFIFYLGDSQRKLSFQVDEALDVIGDFSFYGQVTFALDEPEALHLWRLLNGIHQDTPLTDQSFPDLKRKYVSLFRTMNITRLLIYSATNALLFSRNQPFALARQKVPATIEMAPDARQNFIEGFSLGLLLKVDMPQCLALGLIVFGSYGDQPASPAQPDLLAYVDRWLDDLQKPESLYLYQ